MARVDAPEQSTADLVRRAGEQLTALVRDEMRLARAEMTAKARRFGASAGMSGAALVLAVYAAGALITAVILALALALPAWLAALIVGVVLLGAAGVLGLMGYVAAKQAVPPVPEETMRSVRADIDAVTSAMTDRTGR